jgi:hypothetical protein
MNAAILVLTTLSALLAPAIVEPPANETAAIAQPTETACDVQLAFDDETAVCEAAFDAGLDGVDGLAAQPSAKPPKPLGFCRCGCGIRCSTSADCGGASCDRFITCC